MLIRCNLLPSQTHSLQDMRQQAAIAAKVFIQRDYTNGTVCQFQTKFPSELETRVTYASSLGSPEYGLDLVNTCFQIYLGATCVFHYVVGCLSAR